MLAGILAAVTIPVHLLVLPNRRTDGGPRRAVGRNGAQPRQDRAVARLTVAFTLAMATMAAGIVHLIPYLVDHGWSPVLASIAAGTLGVTQVAARLAFAPTARRTSAAGLAAGILGLPAVAIVVLAFSDGGWTAWIAVALLGIAQGTATLLRPMLLSRLNGPHGYGRLAATSAATTTIARATAPLVLAAIAAAAGYGFGFSLFALASMVAAVLATRALTPDSDAANAEHSLSTS